MLTTPELRSLWERELEAMRRRIRENRRALVEALRVRLPRRDFDFVLNQKGMFSYSGLTADQVAAPAQRVLDLRDQHRAHLRRGT